MAVSDARSMTRPPVPAEAPPGFEWRVVPDGDWTTREKWVAGKGCRWNQGVWYRTSHGVPAVAVLFRGVHRRIAYGYCAEHLYGRWIEEGGPLDGLVVSWVLRESEES